MNGIKDTIQNSSDDFVHLAEGIKDTIQNSSDDFVHLAETQLHYLTILPNNSFQKLHTTH